MSRKVSKKQHNIT